MTPYWDNTTFLFYYSIGLACALLIGTHFGNLSFAGGDEIIRHRTPERSNEWKGFWPMILMLTLFAALRKVAPGIGGTDSIGYEYGFLRANVSLERFEETDLLFGQYLFWLRKITSSPLVFRFVSYFFISFSFCYFIKRLCPKNVSCLPFILVMYPFICGLSSMRNTMAIGFTLLALVALFDKRYWVCALMVLCSIGTHRMMIIFLPMFLVYKPFSRFIINCSRQRLFIFLTISITILTVLARAAQELIILFSLLENDTTADAIYITKTVNKSILSSWPMFVQQFLLLVFLFMNFERFKSRKTQFALVLSCWDAIITLPCLVLGMWRIAQCLYIPTLILWGVLIHIFYDKFQPRYRLLFSLIFLLGFTFIFYKRIESVYDTSSLMPYMFFWQRV